MIVIITLKLSAEASSPAMLDPSQTWGGFRKNLGPLLRRGKEETPIQESPRARRSQYALESPSEEGCQQQGKLRQGGWIPSWA